MKLKSKLMMAVMAVFFLAAGSAWANSMDVTYTVSGTSGEYLLTFSIDESDDTGMIGIFGVTPVGSDEGKPAQWLWTPNGTYKSKWSYDVVNYGNPPAGDVEFFIAGVKELPSVINYIVWAYDEQMVRYSYTGTATRTSVPEPATLLLLGIGLLGMAGLRRNK